MSRFFIPAVKEYRQEEVIKRSRFIVTLGHVHGAQQAKEFVARIQEEFPDATHNCWAWQAGAAGDSSVVGMSDDGEPHGTAGRFTFAESSYSPPFGAVSFLLLAELNSDFSQCMNLKDATPSISYAFLIFAISVSFFIAFIRIAGSCAVIFLTSFGILRYRE